VHERQQNHRETTCWRFNIIHARTSRSGFLQPGESLGHCCEGSLQSPSSVNFREPPCLAEEGGRGAVARIPEVQRHRGSIAITTAIQDSHRRYYSVPSGPSFVSDIHYRTAADQGRSEKASHTSPADDCAEAGRRFTLVSGSEWPGHG
jgi:hypothetical protein